MRYDILPEAQRAILPLLRDTRKLGYVLYGGTAIALQLGHRVSIDFDFFNDRSVAREQLMMSLPFLARGETLQDERDTLTVRVPGAASNGVKLSFFDGLSFGRVGTPTLAADPDLLVASLDDLMGHKLKVLLQRVEAKDYRDIAALLETGLSLEAGLGAAMALFPNLPLCEVCRALTYFEGGDLASLARGERRTLIAHVAAVGAPIARPIRSTSLTI